MLQSRQKVTPITALTVHFWVSIAFRTPSTPREKIAVWVGLESARVQLLTTSNILAPVQEPTHDIPEQLRPKDVGYQLIHWHSKERACTEKASQLSKPLG